jgi:hypothetical protein
MKSLTRGSALVLAGGALALTGAILPAQAATTMGWRVNATFSAGRAHSEVLTSIDAVSARDAWAVGLEGKNTGTALPATVIKHWTGRAWANVSLPAKIAKAWQRDAGFAGQLGSSSPSNVWIIGPFEGAPYLRLNGTHWSVGKLPGTNESTGAFVDISSVRVFSSTDAWAFGTRDNVSGSTPVGTPYAAHFNGYKWTATTMPSGLTGFITGVSAVSASSIWAVTGNPSGLTSGPGISPGKTSVLHWTPGAGWTVPAQPVLPAGGSLTSVLVEQNGHVLAGGSAKNSHKGTTPLAATWNGTAWSVASLPDASSAKWTLTSLAADGRGAWAVAYASNRESSQLWRLSGSTWSLVKPAFGKHAWILAQLAAVPHSSTVWAAGALKEGSSAEGLIAVAGPTPR